VVRSLITIRKTSARRISMQGTTSRIKEVIRTSRDKSVDQPLITIDPSH
jgi:hypothetical protein